VGNDARGCTQTRQHADPRESPMVAAVNRTDRDGSDRTNCGVDILTSTNSSGHGKGQRL
jgi:hypothetical protein